MVGENLLVTENHRKLEVTTTQRAGNGARLGDQMIHKALDTALAVGRYFTLC